MSERKIRKIDNRCLSDTHMIDMSGKGERMIERLCKKGKGEAIIPRVCHLSRWRLIGIQTVTLTGIEEKASDGLLKAYPDMISNFL